MERRKPRADTKPVVLSQAEREHLRSMLSSGTISARVAKRARVLELLADGWAPIDVPAAAGCGEATVRRTRQKFEHGGVEFALYDRKRPGAKPKITKRHEAQIIAMVCADPPQGRARWTIRLVAAEARRRGIVESIGRERVRELLRDHDLRPWREKNVVRSGAD